MDEYLIDTVKEKAEHFKKKLQHPNIIKINGIGLMMSIKINASINILDLVNKCYENGIITDWFLFADDCLRIAPPLVINQEQIEEACMKIIKSLDSVRP